MYGWNDGKQSTKNVFLLKTKSKSLLGVITTPLPSLPLSLDNFAGAVASDGTIYIAGGQSNGVASQQAFSLKPGAKHWKELPLMPDATRIQATAVVQNGANGPLFIVLGGYSNTTNQVANDGVVYDIKAGNWRKTSPTVDRW